PDEGEKGRGAWVAPVTRPQGRAYTAARSKPRKRGSRPSARFRWRSHMQVPAGRSRPFIFHGKCSEFLLDEWQYRRERGERKAMKRNDGDDTSTTAPMR